VATLARVLFECVAENLLVTRPSNPSTSREGGTVLYLNRTLCAHYGLPLGYGGWQETTVQRLLDWMENGLQPQRKHGLEVER
jgi:transposase